MKLPLKGVSPDELDKNVTLTEQEDGAGEP